MIRGHRSWRLWFAGIIVILLVFSTHVALAFDVPAPDGAVTDTAGRLKPEDDAYLERKIAAYETRTTNELGVLVVDSLRGESIEDVAYQVFNRWGVGKASRDNGVLLVIAMSDRKMRIETGKGVGHELTDLEASRILETKLAPELRRGRVREGIDATLDAIALALETHSATSTNEEPSRSAPPSGFAMPVLLVLGVALLTVVGGIVAFARSRRRRSSWPHTNDSSWPHTNDSSQAHGWTNDAAIHAVHVPSTSTFSAASSMHVTSTVSSFNSFGGGSSGGGGASGSF